jgi:hypothetical protein
LRDPRDDREELSGQGEERGGEGAIALAPRFSGKNRRSFAPSGTQ